MIMQQTYSSVWWSKCPHHLYHLRHFRARTVSFEQAKGMPTELEMSKVRNDKGVNTKQADIKESGERDEDVIRSRLISLYVGFDWLSLNSVTDFIITVKGFDYRLH